MMFVLASLKFFMAYIVEQLLFTIRTDKSKIYYFIVFIIIQLSNSIYLHHYALAMHNFGAILKATLVGVIYKKIHSLTLNQIDIFSKGKIINIASSELAVLQTAFGLHPVVILLPYFIVLCTVMLWRLFGFYALFGLFSQILIAKLQKILTSKTIKFRGN